MKILAELSRWLLDESTLKHQWGVELWKEAFSACGSTKEWEAFYRLHSSDPVLEPLWKQHDQIQERLRQSGSEPKKRPVVLPNF